MLVPNWSLSNPAAFDLKVIHPLNTDLILEASLASGNPAEVGEIEKHAKNDQMCARLGWTCIPLVVEVYSGNHHTCSYNFFVLLYCSLEYISITVRSNGNLTTQV